MMQMAQRSERVVKILIQRHTESVYNKRERLYKETHGFHPYELDFGMDHELVDSDITETGYEQGKRAAERILAWPNINLVLMSPLRRCIKTVHLTLEKYPKDQIKKIKAEGILREKIWASCDIGNQTNQLRKDYPYIDFSFMDQCSVPEVWFLNGTSPAKRDLLQKAEQMAQRGMSGEEILNEITKDVIEVIKCPNYNGLTTNFSLQERMQKAKEEIASIVRDHEKELGREVRDHEVLICAHSNFFYALTSTHFDQETGYGVNGKLLSNGEITEYQFKL